METTKLLEMLYNNKAFMIVNLKRIAEDMIQEYDNVSVDFCYKNWATDEPDCNINNFGYNFYFRTNAGTKGVKYKTLARAITEIKKTVVRHWGEVTKIQIHNWKRTRNNDYIVYYEE